MDRRIALVLGLVLSVSAFVLPGAGAELLPLRAARWLAPGSDSLDAFGFYPAECLVPAGTGEEAYLVEIGRAAFRTPLLLGGQAARAGLSCESCHRAGRGNAQFHIRGVSGAPGTADVTLSLFSKRRGDGSFNPRPIPDLSGPRETLKVSRDPAHGELERFIHGLVVEEFDGAEPAPDVLRGLAAYVRALKPEACAAGPPPPLHVADVTGDARRAAQTASEALRRKDAATAAVMMSAARAQLALAYERFDTADLASARARLRAADLDLAAILAAIRAADPTAADRLALWLSRLNALTAELARDEHGSLFNPARLAP